MPRCRMQLVLPQELACRQATSQKIFMSPSVETFQTASAAAKFAELRDKRTPPRPVRANVCNIRRQYGRDALHFGGSKRNKWPGKFRKLRYASQTAGVSRVIVLGAKLLVRVPGAYVSVKDSGMNSIVDRGLRLSRPQPAAVFHDSLWARQHCA